jgi:hypothetical protein
MRGKALPCRNWIDVWRNSVEYPLSFIDSVGLLRTSIICGENLERSGCPRLVAGVSVWEWKGKERRCIPASLSKRNRHPGTLASATGRRLQWHLVPTSSPLHLSSFITIIVNQDINAYKNAQEKVQKWQDTWRQILGIQARLNLSHARSVAR